MKAIRLVEASLNYDQQKAKMQACENGTRGFNAAAASDEKLYFNRLVCHNEQFPVALKIVEDEMIRRGLITRQASYTYGPQYQAAQAAIQQDDEDEAPQASVVSVEAPISGPAQNNINNANVEVMFDRLAQEALESKKHFRVILKLFNDAFDDDKFFAEKTFEGYKLTVDGKEKVYLEKPDFLSDIKQVLFDSEYADKIADKLVDELTNLDATIYA